MAATRLGLYNGALRLCKERKLASLSENREPRRLLDDAWGDGSTTGVVRLCLEFGQWSFASRTVQLDYSPSVEPPFGWRRAFDHPTDMVNVCAVCEDEFLRQPLLHYTDEGSYWYANPDTIYVSYVSNHASYGTDLSKWPETFVKLVEAQLADEIVGNLTGADSQAVAKALKTARTQAKSSNAMRQPTRFPPEGSWNGARHWGRSGRWDRGSPHRLIG